MNWNNNHFVQNTNPRQNNFDKKVSGLQQNCVARF